MLKQKKFYKENPISKLYKKRVQDMYWVLDKNALLVIETVLEEDLNLDERRVLAVAYDRMDRLTYLHTLQRPTRGIPIQGGGYFQVRKTDRTRTPAVWE